MGALLFLFVSCHISFPLVSRKGRRGEEYVVASCDAAISAWALRFIAMLVSSGPRVLVCVLRNFFALFLFSSMWL